MCIANSDPSVGSKMSSVAPGRGLISNRSKSSAVEQENPRCSSRRNGIIWREPLYGLRHRVGGLGVNRGGLHRAAVAKWLAALSAPTIAC